MALAPRAVVVHRRSELELLLERHATRGQAEFFLRSRGRSLEEVQARHDALEAALRTVEAAIPAGWRRAAVERADLPRLRFDAEDAVIAVGQDGLVANVAKYLSGQPVVGVDPEPGRNPGVLVRHRSSSVPATLAALAAGSAAYERRCMVEAALDDGQTLRALNELYIGDAGHQSARYRLFPQVDGGERQSSSGVLIGTGTGATGWCASLARERAAAPPLPGPLDAGLAWFVREAWPSPSTGTRYTQGRLEAGQALTLIAEGDLVVFGDGLEADRLHLTWGQQLTAVTATEHLTLVA
jgi:NAD kinase